MTSSNPRFAVLFARFRNLPPRCPWRLPRRVPRRVPRGPLLQVRAAQEAVGPAAGASANEAGIVRVRGFLGG